MTCTQNCRQGRDCTCQQACELPLTMAEEFSFEWAIRWLWTGMAWLGFFSMISIIAFLWGYSA